METQTKLQKRQIYRKYLSASPRKHGMSAIENISHAPLQRTHAPMRHLYGLMSFKRLHSGFWFPRTGWPSEALALGGFESSEGFKRVRIGALRGRGIGKKEKNYRQTG